MPDDLFAAGARIEQLASVDAVWSETLSALSHEQVNVVLYLSSDAKRQKVWGLNNAPAIYGTQPPSEDPFLEWCCDNYDLTRTGVGYLDDYAYLPEQAKQFIRAAADHGFVSGVAIPMRLSGSDSFGGFNLGTGLDRQTFETEVMPRAELIRVFCLIVHRKLEELADEEGVPASGDGARRRMLAPQSDALRTLSPREREVIWLQAQGMGRKEIAEVCEISPHTVAEYLGKAYRKLGVNSRGQATRIALSR